MGLAVERTLLDAPERDLGRPGGAGRRLRLPAGPAHPLGVPSGGGRILREAALRAVRAGERAARGAGGAGPWSRRRGEAEDRKQNCRESPEAGD